jgi:hypothetical protein
MAGLLSKVLRRRTVASALAGGLGNQMFQYAAGRALASKLRADLVLDTRLLYAQGEHTPRTYGLDAFNIRAKLDPTIEGMADDFYAVEEGRMAGGWPTKLFLKGDLHLKGHWQSEKFFATIRNDLIKDFSLAHTPRPSVARHAEAIRKSHQPVSVHYRRGDYVTNPIAAKFHGTCPPEYYAESIRRLKDSFGKLDIFVFSDDPDWVRDESGLSGNFCLIDSRQSSAAEDIWLMSLCKHHVIANSSFSWWGAWLAPKEGMNFAPATWFLNPGADSSSLVPSRWHRI